MADQRSGGGADDEGGDESDGDERKAQVLRKADAEMIEVQA